MNQKTPARRIAALTALLIALFLLSFLFGRYRVPLAEVFRALFISPFRRTALSETERVILMIRLPRICMACLIGCALSVSGAAYQGVFQNPMASPDLLGASGGAALGAAAAIVFGLPGWMTVASAFLCGLLTVLLVLLAARRVPGQRPSALILAGIMLGSLCTAGISYLKLAADPTEQLPQITYWLMGSLTGADGKDLLMLAPTVLCGTLLLLLLRWRLNLLTLGDEEAQLLGVNAGRLRLAVILCATLLTSACVSVSGVIGWVGLVVPHLCRRLVGANYRWLLPASCLGGAAFLLLTDDLARSVSASELPLGILSALIGVPFFLALMLRKEARL